MKRMLTAATFAFAGLAGIAQAETTDGVLAAASSDASIFAIRDGATVAISAGDALFAGDRLMMSGEGAVSVAFGECSVDMPARGTIVVSEKLCDDEAIAGQSGTLGLGGGTTLGLDGGAEGLLLLGLGAGAVVLAVTTLDDDDENELPASP